LRGRRQLLARQGEIYLQKIASALKQMLLLNPRLLMMLKTPLKLLHLLKSFTHKTRAQSNSKTHTLKKNFWSSTVAKLDSANIDCGQRA
jgi:hypothetical protein